MFVSSVLYYSNVQFYPRRVVTPLVSEISPFGKYCLIDPMNFLSCLSDSSSPALAGSYTRVCGSVLACDSRPYKHKAFYITPRSALLLLNISSILSDYQCVSYSSVLRKVIYLGVLAFA